jgi:adenosylcobinamide-GDP ribazoletransferase
LGAVALASLGFCGVWISLWVLVGFWALRRQMIRRLGGATGDTAGAMLELLELLVLLGAAL